MMQSVFSIQLQIQNQIQAYLAAQSTYTGYTLNWQTAEELGVEHLPAIMAFVGTSTPTDGERDGNSDGSHRQTMTMNFRLFLQNTSTTSLEALADSIYNDVIICIFQSCRGIVETVGNPSLNRKFDFTQAVLEADLEIPIYYFTTTV